jgi:transcriptional regulator GlxA family with amidase domain
MEAHFCDPKVDVETLCGISFISVSSLQRAFAKCLAMSPKQYLIQLRMNRALELLTKNELSVKEIAYSVGFDNENYFSEFFTAKMGISALKFRNRELPDHRESVL